jgi:hypothetical protein
MYVVMYEYAMSQKLFLPFNLSNFARFSYNIFYSHTPEHRGWIPVAHGSWAVSILRRCPASDNAKSVRSRTCPTDKAKTVYTFFACPVPDMSDGRVRYRTRRTLFKNFYNYKVKCMHFKKIITRLIYVRNF